jgi:hypothetical protein
VTGWWAARRTGEFQPQVPGTADSGGQRNTLTFGVLYALSTKT